ncbi:ATP-binding protein [Allocoleopsis franciscana]|uniref:Molecular chaperone of HSP90 family n=1 Tax=Allocoleopsis franciscana PCC 7113 TaxID=1173027 RepID=K9WG90_9CYAN|nr:ATP-binding protein [Allocoleopsis franciscana]AFZ19208.1 molecular chaperone of HSP90 family [Allocoleopsis franciscana PCC 7113]
MTLATKLTEEEYDIAEPHAPAMIESLRAFGYNIQTAIADLIDNSISAGAKNVWLTFFWDGSESYVSIRDDGKGMTETELINAMRPGSRNPLEEREPDDLGRFGLGLKTASFSQCRRLTVRSRAVGDKPVTRRWDLDYVNQTGEWRLLRSAAPGSEARLAELDEITSGTVVLWECMDRLVGGTKTDDQKAQNRFLEIMEDVEKHLVMVFHRFLERRNQLQIWINGLPIEPWEPFLTKEKATQFLPEENLYIGSERVVVQPYVLPHHSKVDQQTYEKAAGPNGWNAQQGFYIYRNERMLVAGDWLGLGLQRDEHCKLARIQVDLPNSMDSDWSIDVKKSRARPPSSLRADLKRIARLTRGKAADIYRHRGKIIARQSSESYVFPWQKKVKHGKVFYSINQEHPLVKEALNVPKEHRQVIRALLRLIQETVPVQQIWLDSAEHLDQHSQPFEGVLSKEVKEVMIQVYNALIKSGLSPLEARRRLITMEPFQHFEELVASLDE